MKEIGLTPRKILNKFSLVIQKPKPNEAMVRTVINGLPVDRVEKSHLQLHGCGDWSRNRSSEGSIVLSNTNYVLKIPLGENNKQEPLAQAHIKKAVAEKFAKVSPPTSFFIAQVDGPNSPPKVITYQKKIEGKPACDTAINILLKPEVNQQLSYILKNMIEVLKTDNFLDGVGLHLNDSNLFKKSIIRLICSIPWFSDNIVVDNNNKAFLVDNTPEGENHTVKNSFNKVLKTLRIQASDRFINFSSRVYSFIKH